MRLVLGMVLLIGCGAGGGDASPADARIDGSSQPPPGNNTCTAPGPMCNTTEYTQLCGNNHRDGCYYQLMPGHCTYVGGGIEACDGTDRRSCTDFGFLGGETTCDADCKLGTSDCDACPSGAACTKVPGFDLRGEIAASGALLAVVGSDWPAGEAIAIIDGSTVVAKPAIAHVTALVGTNQGWLVATDMPPSLTPLDIAGALGTSRALPTTATAPVMAYGPGGRVLVAWRELVNTQWQVHAAIADTSGTIVVPPALLFASDGTKVGVASDGTSFFVGASGTLARVASNGVFTLATDFPGPPLFGTAPTELFWEGTNGYYVFGDSWVKVFDANGASVGQHHPLTTQPFVTDRLRHGDEILLLSVSSKVELFRVTGFGGVQTAGVLGVTAQAQPAGRVTHVGSQVVVAWNAPMLHLRIVSP